MRRFLAALLLAALLAWGAPARAVVIDFDSLQGPPFTVIDQFAVSGVRFNGPLLRDFADMPGFARSGTKAVELCFAQEFCTTPLGIEFFAGQSRVSLWIGHTGPLLQRERVVLRVFDQNGSLIGETFATLGPSHGPISLNTLIELTSPTAAIRSATLGFAPTASGPSFNNGLVIDDVSFSQAGLPFPCNTAAVPTVMLVQPEGQTVNINQFRLQGTIATDSAAPLTEAIFTVRRPDGTTTSSDVLGTVVQRAGGPFISNVGDALGAGSNEVTLRVRNCLGTGAHIRTVIFAPVPAGTRVRLLRLEVVQATQDLSNRVPLVANKPAIVRAYLAVEGSTQPIFNVSATITARRPGGQFLPPSLRSMNVITLDDQGAEARRVNLAATLQFELPDSWLTPGWLHFDVEKILIQGLETNLPCQDCRTFTAANVPPWVQFRPTRPLNLVLVPYNYGLQPTAPTPELLFTPAGMLQWLNNVFPLAGDFPSDDSGIRILSYLPLTATGKNLVDHDGEGGDFLTELSNLRWLLRQQHDDWPEDFRLLAITPCNCGGLSRNSVAYVDTWNQLSGPMPPWRFGFFGPIWAHEIGHMYGRDHAGNDHGESEGGDVDDDFPYAHGGIGAPGLAITTQWWEGRPFLIDPVDPDHAHDFMSYGHGREWISPYTYRGLFARLAAPTAAAAAPGARTAQTEKLLVIGSIGADGSATWGDIRRLRTRLSTSAGLAGDYRIDLIDSRQRILASHYFDAARDSDSAGLGFDELVPWRAGTAEIVLSGPAGTIARRSVSPNRPWVRITSPGRGEAWAERGMVRWQAGDADGDALSFTLLYRAGRSGPWVPVAVGVTGNSAAIDTRLLPGSRHARLRIVASDGVNSAEAETRHGFTVPSRPPVVGILQPGEGARLADSPVELVGIAYDAEDGLLADSRLEWTSDRDGRLGRGHRLRVARLSAGSHSITLTARDRHGRSATFRASIIVGDRAGAYDQTDDGTARQRLRRAAKP